MPVELNIVESVTELDTTVVTVILESASEPGPAGPGVPTGGTVGQVLTKDSSTDYDTSWQTGGGGGGVTDADYLVGTAHSGLSAEIVVGTSPQGELGGTWASPTVDTTHSGSSHATVQAAAEATAAGALSTHSADTTGVHGITDTSALALTANVQPLDSDLTAIAALTTTAFGRGLLELANQAALLSAAGAAAASHAHAGEDITSGTVADARIASTIARDSEVTSAISALSSVYQPLDSDLTAIAALTTTAFGRGLLDDADAAAGRATLVAAPAAAKYIVQTSDTELSAEQALGALATGIVKNTTTTGVLSIATAGTDYYNPGGTDVALADGGTGASLADPGADRIMFWDDSADSVAFLTAGTNLTITGTTIDAASGGIAATIIDAKGDLIAGSAADTAARLAVGATNGMALTVASGETTGLLWSFPPGYELAYAEYTSSVTVSGANEGAATTVVTAGAVTGDGSTVMRIEFYCMAMQFTSTDLSIYLFDGSTSLGLIGYVAPTIGIIPVMMSRRLTPSAASHTYSVRASRNGSNSVFIAGAGGASTNMPGYIRITKV
jgi:hypothetical protein